MHFDFWVIIAITVLVEGWLCIWFTPPPREDRKRSRQEKTE